jgi:hypothetical protein
LSVSAFVLLLLTGGQASGAVALTPTIELAIAPTVELAIAPKVEAAVVPTVKAAIAPKVKVATPLPLAVAPVASQPPPTRVTVAGEAGAVVRIAGNAPASSKAGAIASSSTRSQRSSSALGAAHGVTAAARAGVSGAGSRAHPRTAAPYDYGPRGRASQLAGDAATGSSAPAQGIGHDSFGGVNEVVTQAPSNPGVALTSGSSSGDSLLGIRVPPEVKQGALIATLTILGGMLLLGLLFADEAGIGPRHPAWRARWSYRLPWH